ncbi:Putative SGNH hydrolase superfamily, CtCE2-like domain-containing protein [Colletotrichum destructivum]|uniref:SGNH hydrolase superfamily, CtCE2-like domain-containing protein n=1 Tax=Colletotrichum destructivum TaxID=34406 RepID=A0AAX4IHV0_9PEZI|nr:Putative SGNH hydrolase superfamily, CtCE2-like domain-containing protein [Colletotrichum destructivum]
MLVIPSIATVLACVFAVKATILENGRPRVTDFIDTKVDLAAGDYKTYDADAEEISYKGRWDSKKISWWAAPGIKFGFTGQTVAVTFGDQTISSTLVAYRIAGLDWMHTNVTAGATHLFVSPETPGIELTGPVSPVTFEMRVTNWAYGVQIEQVHVASGEQLIKIPDYPRRVEFIGDSLSAGMYATYEAMAGFAYGVGAGLGNTEYSITAYPGICVADQNCWGNPRGQSHQWFYTSDTGGRAAEVWGGMCYAKAPEQQLDLASSNQSQHSYPTLQMLSGTGQLTAACADDPEPWDFSRNPAADLAVINLGTNDANAANSVSKATYVEHYKRLIQGIHGKWPNAQVIVMQMWQGFFQNGNTYDQNTDLRDEVYSVYEYFNSEEYLSSPTIWDAVTNTTRKACKPAKPFVHFFNTTGILQHNDIGGQWHPTDVGQIKVASHLIQYITLKLGWPLYATGPEVYHETLYWNDQSSY